MNKLLEIQALEIGYTQKGKRPIPLLPPINVQLSKGDFVALSGPNGAGKTTLFRTLTAALPPLSGHISFLGKPLQDYSAKEKASLFSIVLTERPDDFFMKVLDIVATGRYPFTGWYAKLDRTDIEMIEESMERVDIQDLAQRTFVSLSDGEKQKVMIAKALAQNTPIIFLDEPTAFLDFPSKLELMHLLQKLAHEDQKTILFSSHDLELMLRSADKMWLMAKNQPLISGIPEDLVLSDAINTYFGRKNLSFDLNSGHFTEQPQYLGKIGIAIGSIEAKWVAHALQRKGYQVIENENTDVFVELQGKNFELHTNERINTYQSIEKLLYAIHEIL